MFFRWACRSAYEVAARSAGRGARRFPRADARRPLFQHTRDASALYDADYRLWCHVDTIIDRCRRYVFCALRAPLLPTRVRDMRRRLRQVDAAAARRRQRSCCACALHVCVVAAAVRAVRMRVAMSAGKHAMRCCAYWLVRGFALSDAPIFFRLFCLSRHDYTLRGAISFSAYWCFLAIDAKILLPP